MNQLSKLEILELNNILFSDFNIYHLGIDPVWMSQHIVKDLFHRDHKLRDNINLYLLDKISWSELEKLSKYPLPLSLKNKTKDCLLYQVELEDIYQGRDIIIYKNNYVYNYFKKIKDFIGVEDLIKSYFIYFCSDLEEMGKPSVQSFLKHYERVQSVEKPSVKLELILNKLISLSKDIKENRIKVA